LGELEIRALGEADAESVSRLLSADPPSYRKHFEAFPEGTAGVAAMLAAATKDRYWGIADEAGLGALVMLRGLDAGFRAPAFGVYVGEKWSRRGVATLALAFAQAWCRLNGTPDIMLTVHPENRVAREIYEREGFRFSGELSPIGHRVYRKKLDLD
jgi:RimJ/RimL family protein N-acetyltransferase